MTLIDYILTGFDEGVIRAEKNGITSENEQDLFDNESEASYAQMWDAEVFTKSILHKELDDATYSEVYSAFKAVARHIEIENISLESLYNTEESYSNRQNNSVYQPYKNGVRKRKVLYNTNYEQSTEDDFD